mmetsp:Transcript_15927/g.23997  ORF Transcript_15927/g.23997 Transcript_15927/m.23997 type:complete len:284 (-) Transcript_15927:286-1137(-)
MPFGHYLLKKTRNLKRLSKTRLNREIMDNISGSLLDFDVSKWATDNSFNMDNIVPVILYTVATYLLVVALGRSLVDTKRKLSWCITLVNSFIMSAIGIFYMAITVPEFDSSFYLGKNGESLLHGINNLGLITCTTFACANVMDLLMGVIFYRDELGWLSSYFHHTMYTWLMVFAITGNGFFTSTSGPFTTAFVYCTLEEIPTFILALGTICPSYRSDMGFGISFFVLRIVYHSCLLAHEIYCNGYLPMIYLLVLTLVMHLHWFSGWFGKYSGMSKKKVRVKVA